MKHANHNQRLIAKHYFSGFEQAHDTYNAISAASDGHIYYVLSSNSLEGGKIYRYNPLSDQTEFLADLTEVCGEQPGKAIPQGKSHSRLYEWEGKLYIATHVGYYEIIDGIERLPVHAPEGYELYPGGHLISYDLSSGVFENLVTIPGGEGIVTMTMDTLRGQIFGITWPLGCFFHYNLKRETLKDLGPVSRTGEAGMIGKDYRVLCRSMVVDPRNGNVYFSNSEGDILSYTPDTGILEIVSGVHLRLDYFGVYDPTKPGSMGYNWRKIFWYAPEGVAYGVHGNSGYLFRFDPAKPALELVDRITSEPSKRSGMFNLFTYGYLGFILGPDNETIYYLTGGPVYENGQLLTGDDGIYVGVKGVENLHLVTYHIPSGEYRDHGTVFYEDGERPTYVNSIAVSKAGAIYTLARFEHEGEIIADLVKIPDPLY